MYDHMHLKWCNTFSILSRATIKLNDIMPYMVNWKENVFFLFVASNIVKQNHCN